MNLQSSRTGGKTYWRVVQRSVTEKGWPKLTTVYTLGAHETREEAQAAWDALARGERIVRKPSPRPAEGTGRKLRPEGAPKRPIPSRVKMERPEGAPKRRIPTRAKADRFEKGKRFERPAPEPAVVDEVLTPFGELGLREGATAEQVKAAYRRLAAANHPDRGGNPEAMVSINRAYERAMAALGAGRRV